MGQIIPFDEAGRRVRQRRAQSSLQASDWFWLAAVCVWPVSLSLFALQSVFEAIAPGDRR